MNDNYMKTILSGVKEWTENLTDDAKDKANNALDKANKSIDKANNALEQANNALDKALFVVNITQNRDGTLSADKTFDEIVRAYFEGKYNIVAFMAVGARVSIFPLLAMMSGRAVIFGSVLNQGGNIVDSLAIAIAPDNSIQTIQTPLATTTSKLPNPYPLTFTGAVNETYDGSSAKTIEIPIGADGITPTIGDNGNWFLGDVDTNKPSRGEKGDTGARGEKGADGATGAAGADGKSAYSYSVDGGYTGTEAEFAAKLAAESIDKALFVVNITQNSGGTYSADKTFEEITQAYNEGKYSIVANFAVNAMNTFIVPFLTITGAGAAFGGVVDLAYFTLLITSNNEVRMEMLPLATEDSKLPNPYPLTFTGAVSGSYDGSSAKTIEIPSGGTGGGEKEWRLIKQIELTENVSILEVSKDSNGNDFVLSEIVIGMAELASSGTGSSSLSISINNGELVMSTFGGTSFIREKAGYFNIHMVAHPMDFAIRYSTTDNSPWLTMSNISNRLSNVTSISGVKLTVNTTDVYFAAGMKLNVWGR